MREITADDIDRTKRIVFHMHIPRSMEPDDAMQEGFLGLLQAAQTYDPSRGSFMPYAASRIKGAVRDALRRDDYLTRSRRQKANDGTVGEVERPKSLTEYDKLDPRVFGSCDDGDIARRMTLHAAVGSVQGRNGTVLRRWLMGESQAAIGRSIGLSESRVSQIRRQVIDGIADTVGRETLRD